MNPVHRHARFVIVGASRQLVAGVRGGWLKATVICVPLVVLIVGAYYNRWLSDDGLIHLRVVQQYRSGAGLVFNAGERVEVSSSPLWVMVLAVLDLLLPIRLDQLAGCTSSVFMVVAVVLPAYGAWIRSNEFQDDRAGPVAENRPKVIRVVPAVAIPIAMLPAMWSWSTSAMEVGLACLWLSASWTLAYRDLHRHRYSGVTAVVVGLGPLVRQEFVLWSILMLIVLVSPLIRARRGRDSSLFIACTCAPSIVYQIFRMGYFGQIVPNPTIAKNVGAMRWHMGWDWLQGSVRADIIGVPMVCIVCVSIVAWLGGGGTGRSLHVAMLSGSAAVLAGALGAGGDFMGSRLLLPSLFAAAIPCMYVVRPGIGALSASRLPRALKAAGVMAVIVSTAGGVKLLGLVAAHEVGTDAYFSLSMGLDVSKLEYSFLGQFVNNKPEEFDGGVIISPSASNYILTSERSTLVAGGVGLFAVTASRGVYTFDTQGLANPIGSHLTVERPGRRGLPGHEKGMPISYLTAMLDPSADPAKVTSAIEEARSVIGRVRETPAETAAEETAAAARVLACPKVKSLLDAAREPMSVGRFFTNFFGAVGRTTTKIDGNPIVAERELC